MEISIGYRFVFTFLLSNNDLSQLFQYRYPTLIITQHTITISNVKLVFTERNVKLVFTDSLSGVQSEMDKGLSIKDVRNQGERRLNFGHFLDKEGGGSAYAASGVSVPNKEEGS